MINTNNNMGKRISLNSRLFIFTHALLFVLGFSIVFVVGWGGTATVLGGIFSSYKEVIAMVGGVVVVMFGLATLGVVNIPWLNYDTRPEWQGGQRNGMLSSGLMGVFFAAGWTPCIGATLGAILTLGFSQETSGQAMLLAGFYALGLGIPFMVIGFAMDRAKNFLHRFQRHIRKVQIASGVLLVIIGTMLLTNQLTLIAIWATRNNLFLDLPLGLTTTPTFFIALLAGLLSFLSPCVLPLVPAYIGYLSSHALGEARIYQQYQEL